MRFWLIGSFLFGPSVIADPLTPADIKYLENYLLFNSQGRQAPPLTNDRLQQKWPYGVVVFFTDANVRFGTVSHLSPGIGVSVAHTVPEEANRGAVIYFDKNGKKQWAEIEKIDFIDRARDFVSFKLADKAKSEWHWQSAEVKYSSYSEEMSGRSTPVSIWTAENLKYRSEVFRLPHVASVLRDTPEISGASVLSKSTAISTRRAPSFFPPIETAAQAYNPVYLHNIGPRYGLTPGNSGSLITSEVEDTVYAHGLFAADHYLLHGAGSRLHLSPAGARTVTDPGVLFGEGPTFQEIVERNEIDPPRRKNCAEALSTLSGLNAQ